MAETVVPVLVVQGEAGPLVDPPGAGQDVVGPQGDVGVPGLTGEAEHLLDQPRADAEPAGPRFHQQQPQPRGGGVLAHAEHAAGRRAIDLSDPGRLGGRIPVVHVVGDDPGDEGLIGVIPAVLRRVQRPVALYHPAHVARLRGAEQVAPGPRRVGQRLLDHPHGVEHLAPAVVADGRQHVASLLGGPGVQAGHHGAAGPGQPDDLAARVGGGALPADEAVGLEPGQDAAQVARVDVGHPAQVRHLAGVPLRQLEQQPGLGQRVRRIQVFAAQQPDHVRVEPVELADRAHRVVSNQLAHGRLRSSVA